MSKTPLILFRDCVQDKLGTGQNYNFVTNTISELLRCPTKVIMSLEECTFVHFTRHTDLSPHVLQTCKFQC